MSNLIPTLVLAVLASLNAIAVEAETYTLRQLAVTHADPVSFSIAYPKGWRIDSPAPLGDELILGRSVGIQFVAVPAGPTNRTHILVQRDEHRLRQVRKASTLSELNWSAKKWPLEAGNPAVAKPFVAFPSGGDLIVGPGHSVLFAAGPVLATKPGCILVERSGRRLTHEEAELFEAAIRRLNLNHVRRTLEPIVTESGVAGHMMVSERDLGPGSARRVSCRDYFLSARETIFLHITLLTASDDNELNRALHELVVQSFKLSKGW